MNAAKALLGLLTADPANRACADCRSPLVDYSQVYASFYYRNPSLSSRDQRTADGPASKLTQEASALSGGIAAKTAASSGGPRGQELGRVSFKSHHAAFAPDGTTPSKNRRPQRRYGRGSDQAKSASERTGGHGVFVCRPCSVAHRSLGDALARVKSITTGTWTENELSAMTGSGGNARANAVYERHVTQVWSSRRPGSSSTEEEREAFVRAKYEALAFLFPSFVGGSPLAPGGYYSSDPDASFHSTVTDRSFDSVEAENKLPARLVDYFCVVGSSSRLERGRSSDLFSCKTVNEIRLEPAVLDCYPSRDTHQDMEFPIQVSKFVFPEGCRPSEKQMAPTFFTFVLTLTTGTRLYGAAMTVYDETIEIEQMGEIARESGYDGLLPSWMDVDGVFPSNKSASFEDSVTPGTNKRKQKRPSCAPGMIFLPKALVILSHYGFYYLWRSFLQQLYRISLVQAPLPIERYIANFVCEVPLPPQGKVEVKFGFTDELQVSISRPAINRLPLVGFSYRPLFTSLSVGNIMVVVGCLLQETRVALCSKHYGLLGPCAEALLSFLFPFVWQGMYIPVMPYNMQDVLDAPVPYLVGLHSRFLYEVNPNNRPVGVVFVDLDEDTVHLGFDDDTNDGVLYGRPVPALPEKDAAKLKSKLDEFGGAAYIAPKSGVKGRITFGPGKPYANSSRESYAAQTSVDAVMLAKSPSRTSVLEKIDRAFIANELLEPISGFSTEQGTLTERNVAKSDKWKVRGMRMKSKGNDSSDNESYEDPISTGRILFSTEETNLFSGGEVRNAFLRFFVTIFKSYEKYVDGDAFRRADFVENLKVDRASQQFVENVVSSQMFQRFVEDRMTDPNDPEVLFFDESIVAKNNRSRKTTIKSGKKETPFLSDESGAITETFIPPAPSNWGLPDDGRSYHYAKFPQSLNSELYGNVRAPKQWKHQNPTSHRNTPQQAVLRQQNKIMTKLLTPLSLFSEKSGEMDVDWAIHALAYKGNDQQVTPGEVRTSHFPARKSKGVALEMGGNVADIELLSEAKKLIRSARRKQSLLLTSIIVAQAFCRMHLARKRYNKMRRAVVTLQRRHRLSPTIRVAVKKRLAMVVQNVIRIQSIYRMHMAKKYRASAIKIQSWIRCMHMRHAFVSLKESTIAAQAIFRGRRTRFVYKMLMTAISKVQALVRGSVTRDHFEGFRQDRVVRYRAQLCELWRHERTPLAYRTQFWLLIDGTGVLHLSLVEKELTRLWFSLGIVFSPDTGVITFPKTAAEGLFMPGVSNSTYQKYLQVEERLKTARKAKGNELIAMFPAEMPSLQSDFHKKRQEQLLLAAERLDLERLQIYEKLKYCEDKTKLVKVYNSFTMSTDEKRKKQRVVGKIWDSRGLAGKSALVMRELYPELIESTNVGFMKPSKKGRKRFGVPVSRSVPKRIDDRSFFVQKKIDDLIKDDLRDIAFSCFRGMQLLLVKMETGKSYRAGCWQSSHQQLALMAGKDKSGRIKIMKELVFIDDSNSEKNRRGRRGW